MKARVLALALALAATPTHAQAPAFQVRDPGDCVTADSLRAALADVLGDATGETLAGLLIEVQVNGRRVAIALRRPSGLVGARSLDLGGLACDERHATLALVIAVLAGSAGPEASLRVNPQTRFDVRLEPLDLPRERGDDLDAPAPACRALRCRRAWTLGAGYRLLPRWLPGGLGQALEARVGGRLPRAHLAAAAEIFLPATSPDLPGVRATAAGLRVDAEVPFVLRSRWQLAAQMALASGRMTGTGRTEAGGGTGAQVRRQRHGYVRASTGLTLALPLGRGLALTANAGVVLTPFRPRFVAALRSDLTMRTLLHASPLMTGTFALGLRWTRGSR